jgi:hypothetical protein
MTLTVRALGRTCFTGRASLGIWQGAKRAFLCLWGISTEREGRKIMPWFLWFIAGLVIGYLIRHFQASMTSTS